MCLEELQRTVSVRVFHHLFFLLVHKLRSLPSLTNLLSLVLFHVNKQFVSKVGDKASTAKDRSLDKQCSGLMQKICQKYDNLAEVDKLASVARKVDTVKLVMQENVDAALQNCVKLESIEKAAGKNSFKLGHCVVVL